MNSFPEKDHLQNFRSNQKENIPFERVQSRKELLQKELDVNRSEQLLLKKRIELMKSFLSDLPSSDPQYSILAVQIQMDQIEIDELKVKEIMITKKLAD